METFEVDGITCERPNSAHERQYGNPMFKLKEDAETCTEDECNCNFKYLTGRRPWTEAELDRWVYNGRYAWEPDVSQAV